MIQGGPMEEKVLAILKKDNKYIAGVFTPKGLYTSSLPYATQAEAIKDVDGQSIPREETPERLKDLETVYGVHEGDKEAGTRDIELDFTGFTQKQIEVLKVVMKIPFGKTMAYGEVATKAGLPGAARFVGNVMKINRLGPVIPCHRVVSSTGLGGYTGGIDKKIDLLEREGVIRGEISQKALHRMP
jgi:methylated-DNA-[protein]-cysteine S-methyltransferase